MIGSDKSRHVSYDILRPLMWSTPTHMPFNLLSISCRHFHKKKKHLDSLSSIVYANTLLGEKWAWVIMMNIYGRSIIVSIQELMIYIKQRRFSIMETENWICRLSKDQWLTYSRNFLQIIWFIKRPEPYNTRSHSWLLPGKPMQLTFSNDW